MYCENCRHTGLVRHFESTDKTYGFKLCDCIKQQFAIYNDIIKGLRKDVDWLHHAMNKELKEAVADTWKQGTRADEAEEKIAQLKAINSQLNDELTMLRLKHYHQTKKLHRKANYSHVNNSKNCPGTALANTIWSIYRDNKNWKPKNPNPVADF